MALRRAAIGILMAGGLTTGLAVSFGPLGAGANSRARLSSSHSNKTRPAPPQQPNLFSRTPIPLQPAALQQASPLAPLLNKQVGPYPAPVNQQSAGFGQYSQQFGPLATYMRHTPLRAVPNQGFTVPRRRRVPKRNSGRGGGGTPTIKLEQEQR